MLANLILLCCVVLTAINAGITVLSFRLMHDWRKQSFKKKSLFN